MCSDFSLNILSWGKPQKNSSFNGRAIKSGGGDKGRAIKEKKLILEPFFPTFQRPLSSKFAG